MIISSASDGFGCLVGTDLHEWHIWRARDECSERSENTVCAVASTVRAFRRVSSRQTSRWYHHYYSPSSPPRAGERPEAFWFPWRLRTRIEGGEQKIYRRYIHKHIIFLTANFTRFRNERVDPDDATHSDNEEASPWNDGFPPWWRDVHKQLIPELYNTLPRYHEMLNIGNRVYSFQR